MNDDRLRERVRATIAGALGIPLSRLPENASPDTVEQWDSLGHLEIILTLASVFDVAIDHAEAVTLLDEDSLVAAIASRV
jgi:acyl carrier protein